MITVSPTEILEYLKVYSVVCTELRSERHRSDVALIFGLQVPSRAMFTSRQRTSKYFWTTLEQNEVRVMSLMTLLLHKLDCIRHYIEHSAA